MTSKSASRSARADVSVRPEPAKRHTRSLRTRELIEKAALEAFAETGFEAASTRAIAQRAGVKQQLINYHYETKLGLWKAVADRLFSESGARFERRLKGLEGVDRGTQVRLLIREYLLFCAERPEVARFMMHEGARPGPRLDWLFERHTGAFLETVRASIEWAQQAGLAPEADPVHLTYVLLGASTMFSQSAEFELLTGTRASDPAVVERYVDLVVGLLLPGASLPSG